MGLELCFEADIHHATAIVSKVATDSVVEKYIFDEIYLNIFKYIP